MAKLLPGFNGSPAMCIAPVACKEAVIAELCALEMGDDDWEDAGLPGLLEYVYSAKGLLVPAEWKCCFPSSHFVPL